MMYTAKVSGQFVETQSVEAEKMEEATRLFHENQGETLLRVGGEVTGVTDIEEILEEEVV